METVETRACGLDHRPQRSRIDCEQVFGRSGLDLDATRQNAPGFALTRLRVKNETTILRRIAYGATALASTSALSWATWVTLEVSGAVDRDAVHRIVDTSAPYVEDRKMIANSLEQMKHVETRLIGVIDRNTTAINGLRVELAKAIKD